MNRFQFYRYLLGGIWIQVLNKNTDFTWVRVKDKKDIEKYDDEFILDYQFFGSIGYEEVSILNNSLKKHKWYEPKVFYHEAKSVADRSAPAPEPNKPIKD